MKSITLQSLGTVPLKHTRRYCKLKYESSSSGTPQNFTDVLLIAAIPVFILVTLPSVPDSYCISVSCYTVLQVIHSFSQTGQLSNKRMEPMEGIYFCMFLTLQMSPLIRDTKLHMLWDLTAYCSDYKDVMPLPQFKPANAYNCIRFTIIL